MTDSEPRMRDYIREVKRHGTDSFSGYSWLLAFLLLVWTVIATEIDQFPGPDALTGAVLTGILAFLALLSGGYYAWRAVAIQIIRRVAFDVSLRSVHFSLGSQRGEFPAGPDVHFQIELDVRNNSTELILLHEPQLILFDMGTTLLASDPSLIQFVILNPPHGNKSIAFPMDVPEGTRHRLGVQIAVRHNFQKEENLAEHLHELGRYQISFTYNFEDMARRIEASLVVIEGTLKNYADQVVQDWTQRKVHRLIEIVRKRSA